MEYLVAALALLLATGYGVLVAVNIEKGKSWALEIARAISMLDPQSVSYELHARNTEQAPEAPAPIPAAEAEVPDRLAAGSGRLVSEVPGQAQCPLLKPVARHRTSRRVVVCMCSAICAGRRSDPRAQQNLTVDVGLGQRSELTIRDRFGGCPRQLLGG